GLIRGTVRAYYFDAGIDDWVPAPHSVLDPSGSSICFDVPVAATYGVGGMIQGQGVTGVAGVTQLMSETGHGFVDLRWMYPAAPETRFRVERAEGASEDFAPVGEEIVPAQGTLSYGFRDETAAPSTRYLYRVAYYAQGGWGFS